MYSTTGKEGSHVTASFIYMCVSNCIYNEISSELLYDLNYDRELGPVPKECWREEEVVVRREREGDVL